MKEMSIDGIVLYCDGSCVPNPGNGGWGIHGYMYTNTPSKKGTGNSSVYITDRGYIDKELFDGFRKDDDPVENIDKFAVCNEGIKTLLKSDIDATEVTPVLYLDYFGPMYGDMSGDSRKTTTNNSAEIMAFINALVYCEMKDIKNIRIYTDSEYVKDGFTKALPIWSTNNWKRRDGVEIKNKNMWSLVNDITKRMSGFNIQVEWRKGHSVFLGINMADTNANLGRLMSINGSDEYVLKESEANGYWKQSEADKHPLMCHQKLFFNSRMDRHIAGEYFMGAIDKDLGLVGKKLSDTAYSVVILKEPVKSLESLINRHCVADGNDGNTTIGHLAHFYKSDTYKQFTEYGDFSLYPQFDHKPDLYDLNKIPITEIVNPPKKALEAIMALNNLRGWMDECNNTGRFVETDLTDVLYETKTIVKKKTEVLETKLKEEIRPGVSSIDVEVNYRTDSGEMLVLKTILTFGIDLPDRLGLKRIEHLHPKVSLWSWQESHGIFRYFTIVKAGEDIAAYCGYYSNIRLGKIKQK